MMGFLGRVDPKRVTTTSKVDAGITEPTIVPHALVDRVVGYTTATEIGVVVVFYKVLHTGVHAIGFYVKTNILFFSRFLDGSFF